MRKRAINSPTFTNASLNRLDAQLCFRAGATTKQIADHWPRVWYLDDQAKLAQRYDFVYADGRKETNTRMMGVDAFIASLRQS